MRLTGFLLAAVIAASYARPLSQISDKDNFAGLGKIEKRQAPQPRREDKSTSTPPVTEPPTVKHTPPTKKKPDIKVKKGAVKPAKKPPTKPKRKAKPKSKPVTTPIQAAQQTQLLQQEQEQQQQEQAQQQQQQQVPEQQSNIPIPRGSPECNGPNPCERPGDLCFVQLSNEYTYERCMPHVDCCGLASITVGAMMPMYACYQGTNAICWPKLLPLSTPVQFKEYNIVE